MLPPFLGPPPTSNPSTLAITISSPTVDWNLLTELGYVPSTPMTIDITVSAEMTASGTSTAAMNLNGLPSGSTINVENTDYIIGFGGAGGDGSPILGTRNGSAGGTAIVGPGPGSTLNMTNASGHVYGGGGGGGGGGWSFDYYNPYEPLVRSGSGGGGGAGGGAGGTGGTDDTGTGDNGSAGTTGSGGAGGAAGAKANAGGAGGAYGVAGSAAAAGTAKGTGGAAGYAVNTNGSTLNWISGGTSPNVEGTAV